MLNVAILVDQTGVPYAIWDLVQRSKSSSGYRITHLLVPTFAATQNQSRSRYPLTSRSGRAVSRLTSRLEQLLIRSNAANRITDELWPLDRLSLPIVELLVTKDRSGNRVVCTDLSYGLIQNLGIDILINGTDLLMQEDSQEMCKWGMLSIRFGQHTLNRHSEIGFWEVLEKCPATSFSIERESGRGKEAEVLRRGRIPTAELVMVNRARIVHKANAFTHLLLQGIAESGNLPESEQPFPQSQELRLTPTVWVKLRYLFRLGGAIGQRLISKLLRRKSIWEIACGQTATWASADLGKFGVIPNPAGHYLADPILVHFANRIVMFVEDFCMESARGHIAAYELTGEKVQPLGAVLIEDFHLSFPYIFEFESTLYMCPETNESEQIRLYRCSEFPMKWEFSGTLMEGVRAADTMIFPKEDRWWMLTNIDSAGIGDLDSELHVFWADHPTSQHWTPHPRNPVIFDSQQARNGGLIVDGGGVFRVFQTQGMNAYGQSMGISRIVDLTQTHYREEVLCQLKPEFAPDAKGMHTFSYSSGFAAIDLAKRRRAVSKTAKRGAAK